MTNDPARSPRQAELFSAEQVAPEAVAGGAEEGQGPVGEKAGDRADAPGSVVWYALRQKEYYEEGIRSASEFWRAKGLTWPVN